MQTEEFKAANDNEAREAKKQEKKLSKKRKKEAEINAVAKLKRLCKINQEEIGTNLPINKKFDLVDACDSTTAESEEPNLEKLISDEPNSQTSQLPNHVESTLNKSSFEKTTIPPLNQEDNIADKFEEF